MDQCWLFDAALCKHYQEFIGIVGVPTVINRLGNDPIADPSSLGQGRKWLGEAIWD